MLGHINEHAFDDPSIDRGHTVVCLSSDDEICRRHHVAEFIAHRQQNLVVSIQVACRGGYDRLDALAVEHQPILVQCLVELRYPFHDAMARHHAGVAQLVFLQAVAPSVLRRVAGLIRILHHRIDALGGLIDKYQTHAGAQGVVAPVPIEAHVAYHREQLFGKVTRSRRFDPLDQHAELIAA